MTFKTITIRYGIASRSATVPDTHTVADVILDTTNKVVLGYGDNVQAIIHGVPQRGTVVVPDGATVDIEAKANEKA
jgi:hypothetical protein